MAASIDYLSFHLLFSTAFRAGVMIKADQSPAVYTGVSFPLIEDVSFKSHFLHFYEIFKGLTPVVESRITRM
jgi:hypothetical protein